MGLIQGLFGVGVRFTWSYSRLPLAVERFLVVERGLSNQRCHSSRSANIFIFRSKFKFQCRRTEDLELLHDWHFSSMLGGREVGDRPYASDS